MTTMLARRMERVAPTPEKIDGTLLDLVTPIEGIEWGEPSGLYSTINCNTTDATTAMCPTAEASKTFGGINVIDGFRFAVYTGVTCKSVGLNWDDISTQLTELELRKESQAVEKALMTTRFAGVTGGAAATDLTPGGGPVPPEVGLAMLEGHSSVNYSGKPILHMPRTIASLLSAPMSALQWQGNHLVSSLHTPVAAGAGYEDSTGPDGTAAAAGTKWMYASGLIGLARSPLLQTHYQVERTTNDVVVLAERVYVAAVDCYLAAVKVTVTDE